VFAIAMVALLFSGWAVVFAQSFVQLPEEETGIGKCDMLQHIAYIHIPKTAGVSLLDALQQSGAQVCKGGTGSEELVGEVCDCYTRKNCQSESEIAVMEAKHAQFRDQVRWTGIDGQLVGPPGVENDGPGCTAWASTIREPESWFYAAVGQWCGNAGAKTRGCKPGLNIHQLQQAGWFKDDKRTNAGVKYYFIGGNLQSRMLGGMLDEDTWALCAIDNYDSMVTGLSILLPSMAQPMSELANTAAWDGIDEFKKNVPWEDVKQFFQEDQALYTKLMSYKTKCAFKTNSPRVATALSQVMEDASAATVDPPLN